MAETKWRGAARALSGDPPGDPSSLVPDHLPLARAASIIAVVVLAGALFGYDQGVISGALLGIQKTFDVGHVALEIPAGSPWARCSGRLAAATPPTFLGASGRSSSQRLFS
jgi:hypothetical protein